MLSKIKIINHNVRLDFLFLDILFKMQAGILKLSSEIYYCSSLRQGSDTDSIFVYEDFRGDLLGIIEEVSQT